MINENDLFWLAGILEGEGFFTSNSRNGVHKQCNNGRGSVSYITRIGIANTDFEMVKKVSEIFYALGAKFWYRLDAGDKRFPNAMGYIHINVEGYRSCKKIIEAIIDKMCDGMKKKQAELMLDYINYRLDLIENKQEKQGVMSDRDKSFPQQLKELKRQQVVSPSTTSRKASIPLSW